jgi:hypothetical protein
MLSAVVEGAGSATIDIHAGYSSANSDLSYSSASSLQYTCALQGVAKRVFKASTVASSDGPVQCLITLDDPTQAHRVGTKQISVTITASDAMQQAKASVQFDYVPKLVASSTTVDVGPATAFSLQGVNDPSVVDFVYNDASVSAHTRNSAPQFRKWSFANVKVKETGFDARDASMTFELSPLDPSEEVNGSFVIRNLISKQGLDFTLATSGMSCIGCMPVVAIC